jgi:voltage-gated potassium channel
VFRQFDWADLLASLPFPQVKMLTVFRLIGVTRLLRR